MRFPLNSLIVCELWVEMQHTGNVLGAGNRLSGVVASTSFWNEETAFCVLRALCDGELCSVAGSSLMEPAPGMLVSASGYWENGKYGRQFKAAVIEITPPLTDSGIRRYLSSGAYPGIGVRTADKIVDFLGVGALQLLDETPSLFNEIKGVGKKLAGKLEKSWTKQNVMREFIVFALSHGISMNQIRKIIQLYGEDAALKIKADPYRLARDVRGIGFRKADAIAKHLGVAHDSPYRIRAGIAFALKEASSDGHCALEVADCITQTALLLISDRDESECYVDEGLIKAQMRPVVDAGYLVLDKIGGRWHVFLPEYYHAEKETAERLKNIVHCEDSLRLDGSFTASLVARCAETMGLVLGEEQRLAIIAALTNKVSIITGGPGVGKTTITKVLLAALAELKQATALCAPTGLAAERMSKASGREAMTIHRLLGYKGSGFEFNEHFPLELDCLVCDEFSMPDVMLTVALIRAIPANARIVFIGDVDQLPSVGPGRVLNDLIASGAVPCTRLNTVYRQAKESSIIIAAHAVNAGLMPSTMAPSTTTHPGADFVFVERDGSDKITEAIVGLCQKLSFTDDRFSVTDIQTLTPMSAGPLGHLALNQAIQKVLNPAGAPVMGDRFRCGDRVMQTVNDYKKLVYNGEIGFVKGVCLRQDLAIENPNIEEGNEEDEKQSIVAASVWQSEALPSDEMLVVVFGEREIAYDKSDLDHLRLAYCVSIHKSQGSEFSVVILPVSKAHYVMLKRNLIYTAMTRAKTLLIMVGDKKALQLAVNNVPDTRRATKLREWLEGCAPHPQGTQCTNTQKNND